MGAEKYPIPQAFLNAFPDGIGSPVHSELTGILDQVKLLPSGEKPKPYERIWSAKIPVGSANILVGFLDQNVDGILQDFGTHGIEIDSERLSLVRDNLHVFTDRCSNLSSGSLRTSLSDLRVLREVRRHLPHIGATEEAQKEYEENYRKVINPYGKVVKKARKSSNPKRQ